jgi:hypothetical protein
MLQPSAHPRKPPVTENSAQASYVARWWYEGQPHSTSYRTQAGRSPCAAQGLHDLSQTRHRDAWPLIQVAKQEHAMTPAISAPVLMGSSWHACMVGAQQGRRHRATATPSAYRRLDRQQKTLKQLYHLEKFGLSPEGPLAPRHLRRRPVVPLPFHSPLSFRPRQILLRLKRPHKPISNCCTP